MKIASVLSAVFLLLTLLSFCALASDEAVLVTLGDGEEILYEPYQVYIDVAAEISRYSTRQGIAFTKVMESYLTANNVILATDEFLALCAEDMNDYLDSEIFALCAGILNAHYGLTDEEITRCVWENYWSQYVARMMSGFFNAHQEMSGELAEQMFSDFTEQFYENVSFPDDDSVAVFAGEAIPFTDSDENLCTYNALLARLETVDTIAQNRSIEKYINKNGIETDLSGLEESIDEAVSSMRANELYSSVLNSIIERYNCSFDDFLVAMHPFILANFQRAAFGEHCYELYQAQTEDVQDDENSLLQTNMEDFYFDMLASVIQPYTIGYLGWH